MADFASGERHGVLILLGEWSIIRYFNDIGQAQMFVLSAADFASDRKQLGNGVENGRLLIRKL